GRAIMCEVLPTAGLMANLADDAADVGVMITASHNAAPDNGFKILGPGGRKLTDAENALFEGWLQSGSADHSPGSIDLAPLQAKRCYHRALDHVAPESARLTGVRIAVDLANGAASGTARWLQERYPAVEWVFLHTGEGTINDQAGSEHPNGLVLAVTEQQCHAGFAVDGDADRCVLVDERGQVVPGDTLAWWLTVSSKVRSLAVTVMSSTALEASLPDVLIRRTPVGDRHLMMAMNQNGISLGCEESGHVLFTDGLPGGDGVLTGLRALAAAPLGTRPLSETLSGFEPFPRAVSKVRVNDRPPLDQVPPLQAAVDRGRLRLGDHGRIFLRYSGTEPVLRVLVEGLDGLVVQAVCDDVTRVAAEVLC
ncbi:MAG: phosphoglucosamine mutase, partial [Kiritimatiellia bacterium]